MKKILIISIVLSFVLSSLFATETNWAMYAENAFSYSLPSSIDVNNTGILTDRIRVSVEYKNKYSFELSFPINLIVHSDLKHSENNLDAIFFLDHPSLNIGCSLNNQKKTKHSIYLTSSFPFDISENVQKYIENDKFYRIGLLYRLGYISDPVAFYAGFKIQTSFPYTKESIKYYELPSFSVPVDLIFSINKTIALKTSSRFDIKMPIKKADYYEDSKIKYSLSAEFEIIFLFNNGYVKIGVVKNLSAFTANPVISASYAHSFEF